MRPVTVMPRFCFEVNNGKYSALAELWEGWRDPSEQRKTSCTIQNDYAHYPYWLGTMSAPD